VTFDYCDSSLSDRIQQQTVTPFGGISLLSQLLDRVCIKDVLSSSGMPEQGSNRGYDPVQLILNFQTGMWCGANCYEHLEVTRRDEVIWEIFGRERMCGHKFKWQNEMYQFGKQNGIKKRRTIIYESL
jgi:hypothetical protein